MIKILKEGKIVKPTKIIYKGTCSNCGCVFEFEDGDIKSQERHPSGKITVDCPCCGSDRIFAEAKEELEKILNGDIVKRRI